MKLIYAILTALALGALAVVAFAYSGWYDVSASSPHSGLASWLLSTTSHASIERRAAGVDVPDLSDHALIAGGAGDYDAMCAACHGAPGREPGPMGRGLNPQPPNLADSAGHMTPAELFWVTKHGVRMTGMPAWGATHDDDDLWPVVAFLGELPDLNASSYQELLARAAGSSHHHHSSVGNDAEPDHHDAMPGHDDGDEDPVPDAAESQPGATAPDNHEGHDHSH